MPKSALCSPKTTQGGGQDGVFYSSFSRIVPTYSTSSSATAERPRELGDFKEVGQFEAKYYVEGLRFASISMDR